MRGEPSMDSTVIGLSCVCDIGSDSTLTSESDEDDEDEEGAGSWVFLVVIGGGVEEGLFLGFLALDLVEGLIRTRRKK